MMMMMTSTVEPKSGPFKLGLNGRSEECQMYNQEAARCGIIPFSSRLYFRMDFLALRRPILVELDGMI